MRFFTVISLAVVAVPALAAPAALISDITASRRSANAIARTLTFARDLEFASRRRQLETDPRLTSLEAEDSLLRSEEQYIEEELAAFSGSTAEEANPEAPVEGEGATAEPEAEGAPRENTAAEPNAEGESRGAEAEPASAEGEGAGAEPARAGTDAESATTTTEGAGAEAEAGAEGEAGAESTPTESPLAPSGTISPAYEIIEIIKA